MHILVAGLPVDCQLDIVFVLDESGSIGSTEFTQMKTFLSKLVGRLDIDSGSTRVGLVTYATTVRTRFNLNAYTTVASVQSAISRLTYSGGSTNTAAALAHVRTSALTSATGDRINVPNVVVLFTDGRSSNTSATQVCTILKYLYISVTV